MPRATCRCGHQLSVPADGPERIVCPKCGARIRVRRSAAQAEDAGEDRFIRFACPCGRRLKVKATGTPQAGKCPDCGRVVPVPSASASNASLPTSHPEFPTQELAPADVAMLEEWSRRRLAAAGGGKAAPSGKAEAGLRVCPRCKRPVHMGAVACRECGTHVPKR